MVVQMGIQVIVIRWGMVQVWGQRSKRWVGGGGGGMGVGCMGQTLGKEVGEVNENIFQFEKISV